jgi:hypothetical protein
MRSPGEDEGITGFQFNRDHSCASVAIAAPAAHVVNLDLTSPDGCRKSENVWRKLTWPRRTEVA